ncbi:MAG: S41 family peptidase [Firmicutes bacterium]|nr:S41 family peptidase [Bacillota bacterium]
MRIRKSIFVICLVCTFIIGALLSAIAMIALGAGTGGALKGDAGFDEKKLDEINAYINKYYLWDDYDKQELADNAYRGYVAGLGDKYSAYMTKEEYESYETSSLGTYSGIGVTFEMTDTGEYVIIAVTKDSPADRAGLVPDDKILEVDGKFYENSDIMATNIRGEKGTEVKLKILHDEEEKEVTLVREKITQDSVESKMLDDTTGYIQITQFIESTGDDFSAALRDLEKQGAQKLVLDLRNNGGGLVDDAIAVADEFLDEGVACYVQDRNGETEEYKVTDGKTDLDTVVLVNQNSASASEILSAAMQDNGYQIVGEKTFGKGIIQTSFVLPEGDALKLTILEYLSPDKHKVHEEGVTPDVKVKDDEKTEEDEQLEKAEELLK